MTSSLDADSTASTDAEPQAAPDIHTTAGKLQDFQSRLTQAHQPMGAGAIEKVHAKGKLTARERIAALLDADSFVELDAMMKHRSTAFSMAESQPLGDGVVTGYGTIDGRPVYIYSQDSTVFGGSLGEVYGEKIVKVMDLAVKSGKPIIGLIDGAGARIQEGVVSLALYGEIFLRNVRASGVIPQISVVMGAAAGGHVYSPALTDFVIMVDKQAKMFVTGPDVIRAVTGEEVTQEELGGARTQESRSGVSHYTAEDEEDAFEYVKDLLSFLPDNNRSEPPRLPHPEVAVGATDPAAIITPEDLELDAIIPDHSNTPYDMRLIIERLVDEGELLEVQPGRSPNIIVGFARVEGRSVGIVANQPTQLAGCLDINASEKAARFIRLCDAFNIPILTLVDVPGFLPGTEQEYDGIVRRGAKLLYAYGEATVGKITVIVRKAFGGAYICMGSKHMGADVNLAWPTAEIAVMGSQGAVGFIFRKELAAAAREGKDVAALTQQYQDEYEDMLYNPYLAAERGFLDAVIPPSETRHQISSALRVLERKAVDLPPKKHGNIPL